MKKVSLIVVFILSCKICINAQKNYISLSQDSVKLLKNEGFIVDNKVVKAGMSLGFNAIPYKIYDAIISPVDNTLKIQQRFPANFLISTCIVINPIKDYQIASSDNKFVGNILTRLNKISFVATINLVQLGANSSNIFNNKIDGGLGLGYKLSDDFHISFTVEMFSIRQLRDYIIDNYENKTIPINNQTITSLDVNDNNLFIDKYVPGFCIKFIYIVANKENN